MFVICDVIMIFLKLFNFFLNLIKYINIKNKKYFNIFSNKKYFKQPSVLEYQIDPIFPSLALLCIAPADQDDAITPSTIVRNLYCDMIVRRRKTLSMRPKTLSNQPSPSWYVFC